MGRTERPFFHALAALVFAAACAWSAAALFRGLAAAEPAATAPPTQEAAAPRRFRGVLLRREERLPPGAFADTEKGARLCAEETGSESALFFPTGDGWEFLTPEDADRLSPARLEALLDAPAETLDEPRLVYGFTLACAAFAEGEAAPGPCRLVLDEPAGEVEAELLSVTADALGQRILRLRLTQFPQELYERRVIAGEIH